jgi:hypothetical protein
MRLPAKLFLTGAAVIALSSCSVDRSVAPEATIHGSPVLRALVIAQTVDFAIPANGGTINLLGAFELNFPAGAVCDPSAANTQTGYANHQWDAACTPASGDVAVRATLKYVNGELYADFQPALRFVPGKEVTIGTDVIASEVQSHVASGWAIEYAPAIGAANVSDALQDPSLVTRMVASTGKIFRRIKHFSGYVVGLGNGQYVPCDPMAGDPRCVWMDDEGFSH